MTLVDLLLEAGKSLKRGEKRPRASADTTSAGPQSDDSDDEVEGDPRQHGADGAMGGDDRGDEEMEVEEEEDGSEPENDDEGDDDDEDQDEDEEEGEEDQEDYDLEEEERRDRRGRQRDPDEEAQALGDMDVDDLVALVIQLRDEKRCLQKSINARHRRSDHTRSHDDGREPTEAQAAEAKKRHLRRCKKFFLDELGRRTQCAAEVLNAVLLGLDEELLEELRGMGFLRVERFLATRATAE
jgi:hypothetical protein